MHDDMKKWSPR